MYIIAQAPASSPVTIAASTSSTIAAFPVIAGEPGAGNQNSLNAPGSNRLNGQAFTVRASGYVTAAAGTYTSAAGLINLVLYASNTSSFAAATGNAIFTVASIAATMSSATAKTMPFEIEVELQGDNVSAILSGAGQGFSANKNGVVGAQ